VLGSGATKYADKKSFNESEEHSYRQIMKDYLQLNGEEYHDGKHFLVDHMPYCMTICSFSFLSKFQESN
jgi:hypothetical protein